MAVSTQEVIGFMAEARKTHILWAEYFEQCPIDNCVRCKDTAKIAGDAKHHRLWINHYDKVIELLNELADNS